MTSILMVCLGNICRSPLAEGALRQHAARLRCDIMVDSAGTGDWHVGSPPDPRSQEVAIRLGGIDISNQRGRQICRADFQRFDHIVAMDASNLRDLRLLAPENATAQLSLLLDFVPDQAGQAVPDPYHGATTDFENVWHLVDRATAALIRQLGQCRVSLETGTK